MSPLCRAITQAAVVYGDTRDKSGEPGILHPLRVMMAEYEVAPGVSGNIPQPRRAR